MFLTEVILVAILVLFLLVFLIYFCFRVRRFMLRRSGLVMYHDTARRATQPQQPVVSARERGAGPSGPEVQPDTAICCISSEISPKSVGKKSISTISSNSSSSLRSSSSDSSLSSLAWFSDSSSSSGWEYVSCSELSIHSLDSSVFEQQTTEMDSYQDSGNLPAMSYPFFAVRTEDSKLDIFISKSANTEPNRRMI